LEIQLDGSQKLGNQVGTRDNIITEKENEAKFDEAEEWVGI